MASPLFTTDRKLNFLLLITYLSYVGFFILFFVTFLVDEKHTWKLLIFQSLPLIIVAPGLIKRYYRAHSWLCFIVLAYFTAYVVEVGSPLVEGSDWVGLTLSVILFIGAMMSSRELQRWNHQSETKSKNAS